MKDRLCRKPAKDTNVGQREMYEVRCKTMPFLIFTEQFSFFPVHQGVSRLQDFGNEMDANGNI